MHVWWYQGNYVKLKSSFGLSAWVFFFFFFFGCFFFGGGEVVEKSPRSLVQEISLISTVQSSWSVLRLANMPVSPSL